jgi:uncharacterized protein
MIPVSREFQIFIKPVGGRCNLSCRYCYYPDRYSQLPDQCGIKMSDEILGLYIRQHIEATTDKEIFFSWHGGEPLLAGIGFFEKAVALQKKYKPSDKVILNGIQTNATLVTSELAAFLKREKFTAGISLDGPEGLHNLFRKNKVNSGTFREVMKGLDLIRGIGVPFEILCVVSNQNVHKPIEVYRFFREAGATYITFLPLVEYDPSETDMVSLRSVKAADFGRFLTAVFDEWIEKDIGNIKVQIIEEALRVAFNQEHSLCIFRKVCGGVPVVELNGDFYSCDHYVNDYHRIGNIVGTTVSAMLDHPAQKAFGDKKWNTLPRYCLECEVLDMCHGECPRNRFLVTPSGEEGLNFLCEGYRYFFNHCKPFADEVARVWSL